MRKQNAATTPDRWPHIALAVLVVCYAWELLKNDRLQNRYDRLDQAFNTACVIAWGNGIEPPPCNAIDPLLQQNENTR